MGPPAVHPPRVGGGSGSWAGGQASRSPPLILRPDTSTSLWHSHAESPLPTQPFTADRPRASFSGNASGRCPSWQISVMLGITAAGGEELHQRAHTRGRAAARDQRGCACLGEGAEGVRAHLRLPALETCLWQSDRPVCLEHPQC